MSILLALAARPRRILVVLGILTLVALAIAGILWPRPGPGAMAAPGPDPVAAARRYLEQGVVAQAADSDDSDLTLVDYRESLGGRHVHLQQTVNGLPLFGTYVTVNFAKSTDEVTLVIGDVAPDLRPAPGAADVTSGNAIGIAQRAVGVVGGLRGEATAEAVYFAANDSQAVKSWQVHLPALDPLGDWLIVVSAVDGTVLYSANRMASDHTNASGQVFDPNPVVSSGAAIPPPTDCDSAENEALLSGEYFTRPLPGINPGQGQLVGEYVDLTAPGIAGAYKPAGQADEPTHVYDYPCDDDRFEEVMIYYHVDTVQRLIQSLGFTGASAVRAYPLPAHAHYMGDCGAYYDYVGIIFGDGCKVLGIQLTVDEAEDAEVIVHEYGHALQDDQVAGNLYSASQEGAAMGEGFSDFLAAAVFGDPCLFEWPTAVGTLLLDMTCAPSFKDPDLGPFRNLVNDLHYPEDVNPDPHVTGLIWGGALWDLVQALGDDQAAQMEVLTLALQSHFYLNETAGFTEGFAAIRQADIDLNGGANLGTIDAAFEARGISAVAPTPTPKATPPPTPSGCDVPPWDWDLVNCFGTKSLWHRETSASVAGMSGGMLAFNQGCTGPGVSGCTFSTGSRVAGRAKSPTFSAPAGAILTFKTARSTEYPCGGYDRTFVLYSSDSGATYAPLNLLAGSITPGDQFLLPGGEICGESLTAQTVTVPLPAGTTNIAFEFDSVDSALNDFPGQFIDDVDCEGCLTPTPTPTLTPTPPPTPIGGAGFFPDVADSSGGNAGMLAALIAAATGGTLALGGAACYARRRWARR